MRRYRQKRFYEWSNNMAYLVGLIASDGCLYDDGRHIELTSVDIEQLENFCTALGRDVKISKKISGLKRNAYRVQFSDVALYDFLQLTGITSSKSKTIRTLNIPKQYHAHFLRGLFDGDGSVFGYKDTRWKSSYMFYTQFVSASEAFMVWISKVNSEYFGVKTVKPRVSGAVWQISYAKQDTRILWSVMYAEKGCVSLSRKRLKLEGFISAEKLV